MMFIMRYQEILQSTKYKKNIRIKMVKSKIMNQLSYYVSNKKLSKAGLILRNNLDKDIRNTLKLLRNI